MYSNATSAIKRAKHILALVDDYHERPTSDNRHVLRVALMNEFESVAAPPIKQEDLVDRCWYWIEHDMGNVKQSAPAMYLANVECFYSYEFAGIPFRFVKVLRHA